MESNNQRKPQRKGVYLFFVLVLITLISAAIFITVSTTAKKTLPSEKQITQSETKATKSTETTAAEESNETEKETQSEEASATIEEFYMPVSGYISKNFTMEFPVFSATMNDYRTHNGVDIEAEVGQAVYSCANGTVSNIYDDPFMGKCVEISHSDNILSRYMSLNSELSEGLEIGCGVYAGQPIGSVGESCKLEAADEPHLHFEMAVAGKNVNPLDYIGTVSPSDPEYEG